MKLWKLWKLWKLCGATGANEDEIFQDDTYQDLIEWYNDRVSTLCEEFSNKCKQTVELLDEQKIETASNRLQDINDNGLLLRLKQYLFLLDVCYLMSWVTYIQVSVLQQV